MYVCVREDVGECKPEMWRKLHEEVAPKLNSEGQLGPDKYEHRVNGLCTLLPQCKVETTSGALLQAHLSVYV